MNDKNMAVLTNIIGAVESGGQIYGNRRYDAYAGPYTNSSKEVTCTLGWAQNYGNEGRKLCQMILKKDPAAFRKADTAGIESKLSVDWVAAKWNPTTRQKNALIAIITTDAGKECQDALFAELMKKYIKSAEEYGVTSVPAQMMWCEIEHLGGLSPTKRIFNRAAKPYTPDSIFVSLKKDQNDTSNNNQVGDKKFQSRHECCVKWIKQYIDDETMEKEIRYLISNCGHDENNKYTGGKAGDQTGGEWAIIDWYNRPWNYVLRHPDTKVREEIALLAERAARNNLVGYDQNQRTTYWSHLRASNYDPAQITIACEADCSSGVAANIKAAGYRLGITALKNVSINLYTGNLRSALKAAGFEVLSASKYLSSPDYLLRGDILLYEGHHTATNLANGSKSGDAATGMIITPVTTIVNVAKGQQWLNSNYGTLIKSNCGALLVVDDSYGTNSRAAALCVWKDVVNRKYGCSLTPSNSNFLDSCKVSAKKATIQIGTSGTLTYIVEFILSARGYYTGAMDAIFGNGLKSAVMAFQKARGLTVDGIVGPDTWYALFN